MSTHSGNMTTKVDDDLERGQEDENSLTSGALAPTSEQKETRQEVKEYNFFNGKLLFDVDKHGDIYDERWKKLPKEWSLEKSLQAGEMPYLRHVKRLSQSWRSLELLADFMEIGTSPARWKQIRGEDNVKARNERVTRTEVTRLDYLSGDKIIKSNYKQSSELCEGLKDATSAELQFRLYIVEDLSRDVIEMLGSTFDIEPHFFRAHIFDYAWYNTRDRWSCPPRFKKLVREQRWFQIRYNTARYFRSSGSFKAARQKSEQFNVFRRPDDDTNNRAVWDQEDALVAITRTRSSFWLSDAKKGTPRTGILLVDPTVQEGYPLWYGYGNWEKTPSMSSTADLAPPTRTSLYQDIVYWAQRPTSLGVENPTSTNMPQIPALAILHLVASEWLIIAEYIKTRLGQIEWEVSFPEHFLKKEPTIDGPLKKLHTWRRLVPLYREMLTETVQGVFKFPPHSMGLAKTHKLKATDDCDGEDQFHLIHPMDAMQEEFSRALSYMEEYQTRIDRLTSVVTAIISINDSRHSQEDNRNVAKLTWLATFFIPLSFVTGLFSMTENVHSLVDTYKLFAGTGLILSGVSIGLGFVLTMPSVQTYRRKQVKRIIERLGTGFAKT